MFGLEFFASLLLGPLVGAAFTLLYQKCRRMREHLPSRRIMQNLVEGKEGTNIAIASIPLGEFDLILKRGTAKLPSNVDLIGVYDALGAAYLQDNLFRLFDKRIRISSSETFGYNDRNIITVGGSSVNRITYALMVDRQIDKSFTIVYPEHYAVDSYQGDQLTYRSVIRNEDNNIVEDYGFILVGRSPFNKKKRVCILAGIWPYGTYASIYSIINPIETGLYDGWNGLKDKERGFVAAVRVAVAEDHPGIPTLVRIRKIDPPELDSEESQDSSSALEDYVHL